MSQFLLEIHTEELPHLEVAKGRKQLLKLIDELFKTLEITIKPEDITSHSTPRRLAIHIDNVEETLPAKQIIKRGPPLSRCYQEGQPSEVLKGFAKKFKIEALPNENKLIDIDTVTDKTVGFYRQQEFIVCYQSFSESKTADLLATSLEGCLDKLVFDKMMYWGKRQGPFLRPIRSICCLLGKPNHLQIIPFSFKGISSGDYSFGHRLYQSEDAPNKTTNQIKLTPQKYLATLEKFGVIADSERRLTMIDHQLSEIEANHPDFIVMERSKIIKIVNDLVEYPTLYLVDFDPELLNLPPEVAISEMVEHQKYFPIKSKKTGKLLPKFILTANGTFKDHTEVIKGNRRILTSRLRDGIFLYQADLKLGLTQLSKKLSNILYEKTLGSYLDKTKRVMMLAEQLLPLISINFNGEPIDIPLIRLTAPLLKADLASNMVNEFPSLQGIMGRYYAEKFKLTDNQKAHKNHLPDIATAIEEHYLPLNAGSPLPKNNLATLFSIADKLDNLLGLFAVGVIPTGSQDPYALRRQTQGCLRILIENQYSFNLGDFIYTSLQTYIFKEDIDSLFDKIIDFTRTRFRTLLKDMSSTPLDITAVSNAIKPNQFNPYKEVCILNSLAKFKTSKDNTENIQFLNLITLTKRVVNVLNSNQVSDRESNMADLKINTNLFQNEEGVYENALYQQFTETSQMIEKTKGITDYLPIFVQLTRYNQKLNEFFEKVFVNADNPAIRENRINLLKKIKHQITQWVDFSALKS